MSKERILVVDDEADIRELIEYNLEKEGYRVMCVGDGAQALRAARAQPPDLMLLDLMLPEMDGLEVCRALKRDAATAGIPIVMVSAKGEESDVVTGLELGAEDYVVKPFSPRVLVARVRAVLRKRARGAENADEAMVIHGPFQLDPRRREARVNGKAVALTYTEFELLRLLLAQPGRVFTRGQIIDGVRGEDYAVTDRAVDVQVLGLRRKLGKAGDRLETVRGVGYRLRDD